MKHTSRQFWKQVGLALLALALSGCWEQKSSQKPNIIFIMIDDLGYGDIGCYGSQINNTPNIDKLAKEGILFSDYHSNGAMCTPTRASLITGKYQYRFGEKFEWAIHGVTDYEDGLPTEGASIAESLKKAGYTTGMYGKWHLGYKPPYLPANHGFDDFIGLGSGDGDHHTHINRWGKEDWWHNDELKMEEGYSTDLITDHSINFIKEHKDEPFFLYVSHLAIHFPWQGPDDPGHREEGKNYEEDKWGVIPDRNNVSQHVKSMIKSIDNGVGKIMKVLKDLNLDDNTLVIFTSDNGGYTNYQDSHFNISSNAPLRGQKTDVYEGGHRVPFIARWPKKIKANSKSDATVMTMDMYPTFMEIAKAKTPQNLKLDGISILPNLLNKRALPDRAICWKIGEKRAIRKGKWKLCMVDENEPELFDLSKDIGEANNLAVEHPELVKQLTLEYNDWQEDVTASYN